MSSFVNDKLHEMRNNLIEEISSLSLEQFNFRPELDTWSIAQICHHLVLVEKSSTKAIAWGLIEGKNTHEENEKVHQILDRSKKYKAPKVVEPDAGSFEFQQVLDMLHNSRKKLMTFLCTIEDKSILAQKSVKHPALGDLPLNQWIEQIYLHEQRHIEQIKDIKSLI
ncbi:DinB family protein [Oceanobacillus bengalensis]|uniref:DinB family protein n=1 Tax=Oceanobacillus bengalensis TaxID=1435466 RepID=A0A494Z7Z5_9BACI|nr:DinB family protein [Oceanobacillus bengalensis]RKQ18636.1 DinB family protein [Oceanobacillus bengalensis]